MNTLGAGQRDAFVMKTSWWNGQHSRPIAKIYNHKLQPYSLPVSKQEDVAFYYVFTTYHFLRLRCNNATPLNIYIYILTIRTRAWDTVIHNRCCPFTGRITHTPSTCSWFCYSQRGARGSGLPHALLSGTRNGSWRPLGSNTEVDDTQL